MTRVTIVGMGLMGGSLGMVLNRKRSYTVSAWGRHRTKIQLAKRKKAAQFVSTNLAEVIKGADIVVLAPPVQHISGLAKKVVPHMKKGAILTDVGSVKAKLIPAIKKITKRRKNISFVGSHPIAGSEKSGVQHANPAIFKKSTCVITPVSSNHQSVKKIKKMWAATGSSCIEMSAQKHDRLLGLSSHLPHIMSFALFQLALAESKSNKNMKRVLGGSFRDMTRIAAADPAVWAGIISMNRNEIKKISRSLQIRIQKIVSSSSPALEKTLKNISRQKQKWIKD